MPTFPRVAGALPRLATPPRFPNAMQSWGESGKGQFRSTQNMGRVWQETYPALDGTNPSVRALLAAINRALRDGVLWDVQHPYWHTNKGVGGGNPSLAQRPRRALQYDDSAATFVDETTDANDTDASDWALFPAGAGANDYAALGFPIKFGKVQINVGTAGTGTYTVAWEYWNGASWSALSGVVDDTTAFKTAGLNNVTFTVPVDWTAVALNGGTPALYYIRARRDGGTVTADPLGTNAFIQSKSYGNTVVVDNAPVSVTNWLREGDLIAIEGGAVVFDVTENVSTDTNGWATIPINPPIFDGHGLTETAAVTVNASTIFFKAFLADVADFPQMDVSRILDPGLTLTFREQPGAVTGGAVTPLGILAEPAATNYLPSTDLTTWSGGSGWTPNQPLRLSNYGVLIAGATAFITNNLAGTSGSLGATAVMSVCWKSGNGNEMRLRDLTASTFRISLSWDAAVDGSPTNFVRSAGAGHDFFSLGGGWYRIYCWATDVVDTNTNEALLDGTIGVTRFALPQVEAGRSPTTPIPNTTGAAITRAADSFSKSGDETGITGDWTWMARATLLAVQPSHVDGVNIVEFIDATAVLFGQIIRLSIGVDRVDWSPPGSTGTGVQALSALRHLKTLYTVKRTATDSQCRVNKSANGTGSAASEGHDQWSVLGPAIVFEMAGYNTALSDSEIDNWQDGIIASGAVRHFTFNGTLPSGWIHTRASIALREDFTVASSGEPRYSRLPF